MTVYRSKQKQHGSSPGHGGGGGTKTKYNAEDPLAVTDIAASLTLLTLDYRGESSVNVDVRTLLLPTGLEALVWPLSPFGMQLTPGIRDLQ